MEYGQRLFQLAGGRTDERFEQALQHLYNQKSDGWGAILPVEEFLVGPYAAKEALFNLAMQHWHNIHKQHVFFFRSQQLDLTFINERLAFFFDREESKNRLFQHTIIHQQLNFASLYELIFGKKIQLNVEVSNLMTIHLYEADGLYFIQPIFNEEKTFWQLLFAKKAYSLFLHLPLEKISQPTQLMLAFQNAMQQNFTKKRVARTIHKLVIELSKNNNKTFELKQLHMFNVLSHFTSGRSYLRKLSKVITRLEEDWQQGDWMLTEKERVLLSYLLMSEAYAKRNHKATRKYGQYLFEQNRINNHAVEILLEYYHALKSNNPQTASFVKNYQENYLEYAFYMMANACIQLELYDEVYALYSEYEAASCTALYQFLNAPSNVVMYERNLEETICNDIAWIVSRSLDDVEGALIIWENHYKSPNSDYKKIIKTTSKTVCNILKSAYFVGDMLVFNRLYRLYKQHLCVPAHDEDLQLFMKKNHPIAK